MADVRSHSSKLFGERLKQRRSEMNLTQTELGDLLGLQGGQKQISRYEDGTTEPSRKVIAVMAEKMQVDGNWLLGISSTYKTDDSGRITDDELDLLDAVRVGDVVGALKHIVRIMEKRD